MEIFVLNLLRSKHRADYMTQKLKSIGLKFQLFEGTDGSLLSKEEINNLSKSSWMQKNFKRDFTSGEVGCADSHLKVYKKIIEENISIALIFEDDIVVNPRIHEAIKLAVENIESFEWLHLDYIHPGWPLIKHWYEGLVINFNRKKISIFYSLLKLPYLLILSIFEIFTAKASGNKLKIITPKRSLCFASGYFITNEGARKILQLNRPIKYVADMAQNIAKKESGLKLKIITPPLVHQDWNTFTSDIGAR